MAVMQNSIIFGGIDSADFGIYIGGEGTFDAPKRDVEMISIPGRNGAFALDKGRFENIEVTYSAFNHEPDLETFSAQLEGFRNAICSQKGYQRLTDTFHPDEYRMAAYIDGLEIKPIEYNTAATFDIKFDCKPQRFLIAGEQTIEVANGQTITNPTRFESSPMLEVEGYGTIGFNNHEITINDVVIGEIETSTKSSQNIGKIPSANLPKSFTQTIDYSSQAGALESGDSLFLDSIKINVKSYMLGTGATPAPTITGNIDTITASGAVRNYTTTEGAATVNNIDYTTAINVDNTELTAFTDESYSATVTSVLKYTNDFVVGTVIIDVNITNTASGVLTLQIICRGSSAGATLYQSGTIEYGRTYLYSTQSILGSPLYVDCDLGVAYKYEGGTIVSIDQHVDLGSNLPTLGPGENAIAYDVTVTDLKITPRWWKI